jgi:kynurenine 3-monooxygenase
LPQDDANLKNNIPFARHCPQSGLQRPDNAKTRNRKSIGYASSPKRETMRRQKMNAGFEDCHVLNQLLDQFADDWDQVLPSFQDIRKPNADAIAKLALDNFVEMRDLVNDADFILRKKIESKLHELFPEKWIPLYSMVTFHENIPYSIAYDTGQKQKRIMEDVLKQPDIESNWPNLHFEEIVGRLIR